MYLTYDEYINMGGLLEESAFIHSCVLASKRIDRETMGRVKDMTEIPVTVKGAVFELIELYEDKARLSKGKAISSESVEGWSRSYSAITAAEYEQTESDLLLTYLSGVCDDNGVPLLYRGVG